METVSDVPWPASGADDAICPLCRRRAGRPFHRDHVRDYLRCAACTLVYVPARYHLSRSEEKQRYDTHRNSPEDTGYRRFLSRLFDPLVQLLSPGAQGLDYGSGPGPTLSVMFEEAGFRMEIYDPFYAPDSSVLGRRYDFVTCSETVEHFARPGEEFRRLVGVVRPGGWIGIMTQMLEETAGFADWYYIKDPTHVAFYSDETFRWLASHHRLRPRFVSSSVVLLQRES